MEHNSFEYTYSAQRQQEVEEIRKAYLPKEEDKMAALRKLHAIPTQKAQAASLVVGFSFGALYDLFRIRRRAAQKKGKQKKLLTRFAESIIIGIEDVVFFLMLGCVTCVMYYVFSNGKVRLLALVFELLGFVIYRVSIGRLVMSVTDVIIAFFRLIMSMVRRHVVDPIKSFVCRIASGTVNKMKKSARKRRRLQISRYRKKQLIKASEKGFLNIPEK